MVVPLKLTQFYGHRVPRPRIYPDVKFNDARVDPPPSVNGALLSWASDAHWSMGGLSFKRFRSQGKVEGNVRRLRALLEEEDDSDGADMMKPSVKEATKRTVFVENAKASMRKDSIRSAEKRKQGDEEIVEVTPARKLRRAIVEESDEESPICVPATEERGQAKKSMAFVGERGSSSEALKKGPKSPSEDIAEPVSKGERERKLGLSSSKSPLGIKAHNSIGRKSSRSSDGGRLTRSARKVAEAQFSSPQQFSKRVSRAKRKVLLASDSESSDSDDGLEEFLKEKSRPLRRSGRLGTTDSKACVDSGSESD